MVSKRTTSVYCISLIMLMAFASSMEVIIILWMKDILGIRQDDEMVNLKGIWKGFA